MRPGGTEPSPETLSLSLSLSIRPRSPSRSALHGRVTSTLLCMTPSWHQSCKLILLTNAASYIASQGKKKLFCSFKVHETPVTIWNLRWAFIFKHTSHFQQSRGLFVLHQFVTSQLSSPHVTQHPHPPDMMPPSPPPCDLTHAASGSVFSLNTLDTWHRGLRNNQSPETYLEQKEKKC